MKSLPKNKRLYKKALDILSLSRNISNFLIHDLHDLNTDGTENAFIYFTGDIIQQSDALMSKIITAENQLCFDDRIRQANSLRNLTNRIYKNCERLERTESNGKDFIILLRKELMKFKKLQHHWIMTL